MMMVMAVRAFEVPNRSHNFPKHDERRGDDIAEEALQIARGGFERRLVQSSGNFFPIERRCRWVMRFNSLTLAIRTGHVYLVKPLPNTRTRFIAARMGGTTPTA